MYLSRVYIRNFRSIQEMDLHLSPGKNVIVGKNNSGKSNIIRAINLILGEFHPTFTRAENLIPGDFHSRKSDNNDVQVDQADQILIWCELVRTSEDDLDFTTLKNAARGFSILAEKDLLSKTSNPLRIHKDLLPEDEEEIFQKPENTELIRSGQIEGQLRDKQIFALAFRAKLDQDGEIDKDMRFLYREDEGKDWILALSAPFRNELLQSAIIPSFRDPSNQLRLTSSSWYGRLIKHLIKQHENNQDLLLAIGQVSKVSSRIFENITKEVSRDAFQVAFPGTEVEFTLNTEKEEELYKSAVVYIDDGFRSQLSDKGSGIQSATIIGLFNYYVQNVSIISSALLCVEEPELYLHPHARRVINDKLDQFSDGNRNQVLISTHSPEFLRVNSSDFNVISVKREDGASCARSITVTDFHDILIDNNQNELFFSDRILLVENYDGHLLRLILDFWKPGQLDAKNVSIVVSGGKDRIPVLAKRFGDFGIPIYVMADFDFLLRDKSNDAPKGKAHNSVESLTEEYFCRPYVFGEKGAEVYKRVQQFRANLKKLHSEEFYGAKNKSELSMDCSQLLQELRSGGLFILDGELEDILLDKELLGAEKKFKPAHIFKVNGRLSAGENVESLFDVSQLDDLAKLLLV